MDKFRLPTIQLLIDPHINRMIKTINESTRVRIQAMYQETVEEQIKIKMIDLVIGKSMIEHIRVSRLIKAYSFSKLLYR